MKRVAFFFIIIIIMVLDEYQALDKQSNDSTLQFLTRVEKQPACKERHAVHTAQMTPHWQPCSSRFHDREEFIFTTTVERFTSQQGGVDWRA